MGIAIGDSSVFVLGNGTYGSTLSVRGFVWLGSSVSTASGVVGTGSSVLDTVILGSSLFATQFARVGSSASLVGGVRLGQACAVLQCSSFGSSLSVPIFARVGSALSVLGCANTRGVFLHESWEHTIDSNCIFKMRTWAVDALD